MKNFLRVTMLAICAIFMVTNASAQDNYDATTMGEKVYLETASWGQNSPFNKQIFTSYGGSTNAKAGCVPTAYAIVMRYHGFPEEGTAKVLYNCQAPTYVEITDRVYDFSKMPLTNGSNWTEEQQAEVAKFFSHVLHACFPSSIGTGATTVNEGSDSKVLNDYFNYQLINASYQANFTMEQWIEKIKESIDNGCPIPYASDNSGTGDTRHMFVLDGYTANNYFHFNFGWNGGSNGWFKLDDITPSQGDNYSWIDGAEHYALFNLAPNRTIRTVTASVSPAGAGTVTVNGSANSAEVMEGITATLVATANSGYTFSHWSKDGTEVGTEMTYSAKVAAEGNEYVANFYTIGSSVNIPVNYDSNMGSVTYNGNIVSATGFNPNEYSEVTLTAEANDGYMFTGWEIVEGTETTKSSEKSITFIAKSGIEVTAHFALAGGEYTMLKDNIQVSGAVRNNIYSTWTYDIEKDLSKPAAIELKTTNGSTEVCALASSYNRFYAGAYDANGTRYSNITYTLTAPEGFVITSYKLTYVVQSSYTGTVTVANSSTSLTPNDTNNHDLEYQYAQTRSSISNGVKSTVFTVSTTSSSTPYITVKEFTVNVLSEGTEGGESTPTTYTINVTANPGTGGTATVNGNSSATVGEGSSVTLAATPAGNYIFTGWYNGAEKVSGNANYTFTPTESASYEARFVAKAVSNCNIPTDNTLRYYRFAIAIAQESYTRDFGSSYDNVKQFWQECEDFMNEVYVPLGMCFDVVIDQRLLLGTDLPINNGLPNISGVTDLINNAIGSASYDVGLCISYRDNSEENTGLSAVNGAYSSTTKANGYAQADKWVVAHEAGHLFGADHTTEGESSLMDNIGEFFSYPSIKKIRDASVNNGPGNAYKSEVVANNAPTFTAQMKKTYRIPKGACLSIPVYANDADGHSLRYAAIGCSSSTVGNITGSGTMPHFASLKPQTSNIIDYSPKFVADGDSYYLPVDGTNIPSMSAGSYSIAILVNDMPEGNSYDYLNSNPFYSNYDVWDATVEIVDGTPFTASISPAQNSYTAGSNVTVTWGVNNSVFTEDSRVRITMSTDYGKTFSHVLADDVRALDGSKAVTLPNVNVGNVDVDFSTQYVSAVRSMRAGIIRVEIIDGAAYTLTTLSPENGGGFNITGGGAEPDPTPVTYTITTAANPAEGGTAKFAVGTGSQQTQGNVNDGEQITLYAVANTGYNFVNWTLNSTEVSTDATCNVTASQAANYVANFDAEANEPELPEFDGTKEETSYTDANWFRNNKGTDIGYGTESWGYKVVTENETSTVTLMVKDKDNSGYYKNNLGFRSVEGVNHPFLFKGTTFTISVPEQHKITGYSMTVVGENFNAGTVTYTTGAQMARSNTSTATISGTTPATLNATGLDTNSIEITLGSATASTAGVTITDLDIYYKAYEPEYTLGDRLTSAQLMSVTKPTHIAVKNLSKTNNWYFAGTTNVENFGNEAVFVWTPKTEGVAGEYYLKTLDGKYLGAAGDNTSISYTEDVANAAVFTTLKPVAGNTDTSRLDKDSDTGTYVDNDDLLVRFMTKYSGGTGDVTTWINVTNTTSPNQPKYYNGGYGMYTAHFVYAVSVDGVAPELPDVLFPDGAYKIYWQSDNRGYLAYHATDYPNEAKLAGVGYSGCQNIHYSVNDVDLVWYLITADDGKRYLFQAATGKFLGANPSIDENGIANKLSTTEAWPIAIEENTKHTGHYIITTEINSTNSLLCSGCGTPKEQHPVRWLTVNDGNQTDGGAPLQLIPVNDVTVADNVMNAVLAVINGTDEPEQPTDPLAGKYFRLKVKNTTNYMNIANTSDNTGSTSGVTVVAKNESSDTQVFLFEQSGNGYKLKANSGNYIKCHAWNANANATTAGDATELTFESTGNELEYFIKWDNKNTNSSGIELDDYFKVQNVNGTYYVFDDAASNAAATWVLEEVVMQKVYIKAEIDNWRDNNPNTHLGTITIGGTAMKLTPAHQTASELTMPLAEGTTLAFTRKYRGFEFQGFYIGSTSLGENPTLTADNVAAINEKTPLVAKFTATDDVTLFYDDDQYSYRIPAIAKTGNGMLVAVSDYRHNLDDIGRDNHGTGKMRIDLVARTSDDNGATWSDIKTIAAGDDSKIGSYQRAYGDAAIAAVGENIVVMAAAGDVMYSSQTANATNPNKMVRVFSSDNGANWSITDMTTKMYSTATSLFPNHFCAFFGSGKLAVDYNYNGTSNARIYGALLMRNSSTAYNNFVVYSDDLGENWSILGGSQDKIAGGDEPKVEILPNGQILLSARRQGGRIFRVFTYSNKATNEGSWGDAAVNGCDNGGSNGTNGEIICLDAKRPNGKPTKILLQSQPKGGAGHYDRYNVTIWYKEVSADETYTPSSFASGWTQGIEVCPAGVKSAYSAMALQENGEIAFFFEEAPCYGDDHTKGYSMVYVPLTIEEITGENFLNPNADVEYVPTEFNIVLTDAQGNEYRETLDYIPADVATVESYLTTTYPFITLGTTGAIAENKYTNTVTLPFKVSNANTTVWHNIYWPANGTSPGEFYPIYMMANADNATTVAKITEKVHYGNSQYNTYNYADKLGWAVYNVNNSFTFKFKNKLTGKFMAVNGVVSSGDASNVIYTDEANATAFTLTKNTGTTYKGDFAITSVYNGTTGYVCNTSAGYADATNYTGNGHHGAWAKIVESPDYWTIYEQLIADINNFGDGDGKYTENDAISSIDKDALSTMLFSDLTAQATAVQTVKDSYREITLTVPEVNDVVPGSVSIAGEPVNNKFVPGNTEIELLATANAGYVFKNWTRTTPQATAAARTGVARATEVVSTDNPYRVTVSDALSLTANFEQTAMAAMTAILTDKEGNTYRHQFDELPGDAAAIKAALEAAYPFITLGKNGAIADNTYTNTVELPFRVSNNETTVWHNIYWPANGTSAGEFYPIYLMANANEATYVAKITEKQQYSYSQYNTLEYVEELGWAVYSVDNTLTFKFKNRLTEKFMAVDGIVSSGNDNNVIYTDEANATVFTLTKNPGTNDNWKGDWAITSVYNSTTGYICNTSAGHPNATNYTGNTHPGAWVKFVEAAEESSINDLRRVLDFFGEGALYVINNDVQEIITALESPNNIKLNTLDQYGIVLDNAMTNWKTLTLTVNDAMGSVTINNETRKTKKAPSGFEFTVVATPASGYRFTHWSNGTTTVSTDASYTFNMPDAATELTANFEIEESQEGLTTGYYHLISRATGRHEHLYNNAFSIGNNNGYTLQSDNMVNTNNGIWYITVDGNQLGIKNGDGKPVVAGNSYNNGIMGTYSNLNIHTTIEADGYTYYYFSEALNCSDSGQSHFKVGGINYLTTWTGNPNATDNHWRLELVDTDGKNIYNVVVECTNKENVYVTYGSEYAFDGGFFITDATITADQLTTNVAQGVTVLVEGNTIRVVDTEYVDITVSASPAEGGTVTINSEATSTKQVVKSSNVTVVATPASGYHFVNWTDAEGNVVSTNATYTFTASENTSLVANYEADVVYHTITVSTYYNNNGGTVKVGEEDATSVNVIEGHSVRMLATPKDGYEFMGWLNDGVIVKNAIDGGLDFEVQGPDYTLYEVKASAEYVAVFSKITDYTNLEDGKAYRICGVQGNGQARCIYRDGNTLKWKYDYDNNDVNTIFVAQKNGNAMNLISAVGYHGWKASDMLGNDEQYNPYAAIKVTYGTRDELRTLYIESGTSSGLFQTNINGAFSFQNSRGGGLSMVATDEITTDFLFVEVDTYAFQVSAADGSNAKLGTVNLPFATTVPAEVTVYGVNDSNEDYVYVAPLELTDNVLPANTPVLIEAAASGKYGFKPAPASANVYETGFAGTLEAEAIPGTTNAYILSYKGVGTPIKMYKLSSTDRTINANKAYFIDSTGKASALQFVFGGTTDIEDMEGENGEIEAIYDLQGRKLSEITEPGFYIIDGKKVWVK